MEFALGNKVYVTDPCYGTTTWCLLVLSNIKAGIWEGDYEKFDDRVKKLVARHKDNDEVVESEYTGYIGVDSGQAGIFDYDYYRAHHDEDTAEDAWYDMVCDITLTGDGVGTVGAQGIVSRSGYGDGAYDVKVGRNKDGQIVEIEIEFICTEDEEN